MKFIQIPIFQKGIMIYIKIARKEQSQNQELETQFDNNF